MKTRLEERPGWYNRLVPVLTDVALCEGQGCQSPAIHQRETCGPGRPVLNVTLYHIICPVVWQLLVELDQCTVRRQNSRDHRHPNRNTQGDHQTPREHIDGHPVAIIPRLELRLQLPNPHAAVSDWLSGSVGDLRRTGSTSGSPENRPVFGFGFPYGRTMSTSGFGRASGRRAPGLRLRASGLRPPGSGQFSGEPEECHHGQARRRKSINMVCRVCARIPFLVPDYARYQRRLNRR